jgi:hypothetical protein
MWWSSNNNMGGSTVARMLVRMISSLCNLIKHYCYLVDHPSWALVMMMMMMMMMMILIIKNHYAFIELCC